ncbi:MULTISPECIES: hypothetical protein [Enterobacter]|uniref:hypothetical protein n=1 Tax=Enterobacter TaxID=547 RepID=UPI0004861632|nr:MULTISPECIES: hypothetical protein [Enterobacter cloacae complex]HDT2076265.1 hypothetical protein [Enterobacter roggenkampii]HEG2003074.1 hypothetical protein [Enterobacter asburiae]MCD2458511.1 hypothetical protein [Enterobacter cloacae complex sp. 2021EL-01261]MDT9873675.1 hypothetical protein [Enterobacter cloacae]HDT2096257.1 hypothetical protein [Enterobacter roggenkampii]
MISPADKAAVGVWLVGMAFGVASIIASVLNRKRFKEICVLYKEKYGSLPDAVLLFENVNTLYVKIAYSTKVQFIYIPLLWNRNSILTKNDDKDFIRGLPKRLIGPFYVEIYLGVVSLIFLCIGLVLIFAIEHGWV